MKLKIKHKPFGVTLLALPDIAFLLLIFLILTVSVDDQGEIELPDFKFLQETEFLETVVLTLSKSGMYQLEGQYIEKDKLNSVLNRIPDTTVIHLMADKNSLYRDVDSTLEELQKAGLRDIVLIMDGDGPDIDG
ncbi:MAG: biopolymer transporter ExbD [Spirochaetales bacterium]|nr:biopolymer transporter ExbD [Spirochaetales bacterium]